MKFFLLKLHLSDRKYAKLQLQLAVILHTPYPINVVSKKKFKENNAFKGLKRYLLVLEEKLDIIRKYYIF